MTDAAPVLDADDPAPLVRYEAVTKRFGAETALDAVSLDIRAGEFFALLGPSGCGKSILMRLLAGFETPDSGRVLLDGVDLAGMPPHRRPVNMMFQSYALFPHMSVEKNVAFGLEMERAPRDEIAARVGEVLDIVKMRAMAGRRPDQLSGGQRQRVALARALVKRPKALLLDEPLGALDRKLREETQFELAAIRARLGLTFIVVTHDQDEAMAIATRIAVMDKGRIAQIGTPQEIYEAPATRYVASFIGDATILSGRVAETANGRALVDTPAGRAPVEARPGLVAGETVSLAFRPEKARLVRGGEAIAGGRAVFEGRIAELAYRGDDTAVVVACGEARLKASHTNAARRLEPAFAIGEAVRVVVPADAFVVLKD